MAGISQLSLLLIGRHHRALPHLHTCLSCVSAPHAASSCSGVHMGTYMRAYLVALVGIRMRTCLPRARARVCTYAHTCVHTLGFGRHTHAHMLASSSCSGVRICALLVPKASSPLGYRSCLGLTYPSVTLLLPSCYCYPSVTLLLPFCYPSVTLVLRPVAG